MTGPEPLDTRGPDEPRPDRLALDHPRRAAIIEAHRSACLSGDTSYTDPVSGYQVMTSAFLAERGVCCHQGCRHCPYPA
ncbi:MAG: DUF5522 domain-containing protein [Acidimicrobiales bacterium]